MGSWCVCGMARAVMCARVRVVHICLLITYSVHLGRDRAEALTFARSAEQTSATSHERYHHQYQAQRAP